MNRGCRFAISLFAMLLLCIGATSGAMAAGSPCVNLRHQSFDDDALNSRLNVDRVAVVIGVSYGPDSSQDYVRKRPPELTNPLNDAHTAARFFSRLGISVLCLLEPTLYEIQGFVSRVGRLPAPRVIYVYFAGHGFSSGESNFLLPSDADLADLERSSVVVFGLYQTLLRRERLVALLLDACREQIELVGSGETSSTRRVLSETLPAFRPSPVGRGALVFYSTTGGDLAHDLPESPNGLFMQVFSETAGQLGRPLLEDFSEVASRLGNGVLVDGKTVRQPAELSVRHGGEWGCIALNDVGMSVELLESSWQRTEGLETLPLPMRCQMTQYLYCNARRSPASSSPEQVKRLALLDEMENRLDSTCSGPLSAQRRVASLEGQALLVRPPGASERPEALVGIFPPTRLGGPTVARLNFPEEPDSWRALSSIGHVGGPRVAFDEDSGLMQPLGDRGDAERGLIQADSSGALLVRELRGNLVPLETDEQTLLEFADAQAALSPEQRATLARWGQQLSGRTAPVEGARPQRIILQPSLDILGSGAGTRGRQLAFVRALDILRTLEDSGVDLSRVILPDPTGSYGAGELPRLSENAVLLSLSGAGEARPVRVLLDRIANRPGAASAGMPQDGVQLGIGQWNDLKKTMAVDRVGISQGLR